MKKNKNIDICEAMERFIRVSAGDENDPDVQTTAADTRKTYDLKIPRTIIAAFTILYNLLLDRIDFLKRGNRAKVHCLNTGRLERGAADLAISQVSAWEDRKSENIHLLLLLSDRQVSKWNLILLPLFFFGIKSKLHPTQRPKSAIELHRKTSNYCRAETLHIKS